MVALRPNSGQTKIQVFHFQARKEIFKIHTRDWTLRPLDKFLEELAEKCVGEFENTVGHCTT